MNKKNILTLSNFLSFSRIFLAIPMVWHMSRNENMAALAWVIVAMATDWLDGYFARKFNQETQLGKILDPLADKVCTTAIFITLSVYQGFPYWITAAIIVRDLLIIVGSLFIIGKKHVVAPSNKPGKFTVFSIALLGIAFLLQIQVLIWPLTLITTGMIIYSGVNYAIVFYKNIA